MNKIIIATILFFMLLIVVGYGKYNNFDRSTLKVSANLEKNNNKDYPISSADQVVDKLEVYYFHRTQRCYSCNTLSQYARETIEQRFSEEIKNGKINFREINVDLSENKDVAKKFQASGSSLFINAIRNGKDDISQDSNVWRLLRNEAQFKSYLENKINSLLGK